jgi:hypothetical protein
LPSGRLSWRRLGVLVRQLPQESATWRSIDPEAAMWTLDAHLAALQVDAVHVGNWQRAGKKGARRPKPVPRPGVKASKSSKTFGGAGMSMEAAQAKHQAMVDAAQAEADETEEVAADGS